MTLDPLAAWASVYPVEETIARETETLTELRTRLNNAGTIRRHIANMTDMVAVLSPEMAARYASWCLDPATYTYGSEAYYQSRIIAALCNLQRTEFAVPATADILVARQILKPTAFNGSPRIKRLPGMAFVIFQAPSVFWMYEIMGMIAHIRDGRDLKEETLREYLFYLLALRVFNRFADHETACLSDYLIDEIVRSGRQLSPEEPASPSHEILPFAVHLVHAIEDFVIHHELAHFRLNHGPHADDDVEAEADREAIRMITAARQRMAPTWEDHHYAKHTPPSLGYLALRLWTTIRLTAEYRVLHLALEDTRALARERDRITTILAAQASRADTMDAFRDIPVDPLHRAVVESANTVQARIMACTLDRADYEGVYRLAKTFAQGEYTHLLAAKYTW